MLTLTAGKYAITLTFTNILIGAGIIVGLVLLYNIIKHREVVFYLIKEAAPIIIVGPVFICLVVLMIFITRHHDKVDKEEMAALPSSWQVMLNQCLPLGEHLSNMCVDKYLETELPLLTFEQMGFVCRQFDCTYRKYPNLDNRLKRFLKPIENTP